jgi:hypothetical protein
VSLANWQKNGWLVEHRTSRSEIRDLMGIVARDLEDCRTEGLSPDWRLNIAYNAALQATTAALSAAGFRASREAHHYRVIESLALTVGASSAIVRQFDAFRRKRNIGGYDRAGTASDQEASEMIALAEAISRDVSTWLRKNHPGLA